MRFYLKSSPGLHKRLSLKTDGKPVPVYWKDLEVLVIRYVKYSSCVLQKDENKALELNMWIMQAAWRGNILWTVDP